MKKLKVLDLFSGIGGFSHGLERTGGFETVAFCEIEPYPQKVLKKHWPDVPIAGDIYKLSYNRETQELIYDGVVIYVGAIDLICGGYPCQPFSHAGKRQGTEDERHLWPEVHRLMATIRPTWGLFENVIGHITLGLDQVLFDLENEGYAGQTLIIPACALDAPHRRNRVWIIAHNDSSISSRERANERKPNTGTKGGNDTGGICENVANPEGIPIRPGLCSDGQGRQRGSRSSNSGGIMANTIKPGLERHAGDGQNGDKPGWEREEKNGSIGTPGLCRSEPRNPNFWLPEPAVGRVANGVPRRVDRLKGLGNAVIPQIPEMIGYAILEATNLSPIPPDPN